MKMLVAGRKGGRGMTETFERRLEGMVRNVKGPATHCEEFGFGALGQRFSTYFAPRDTEQLMFTYMLVPYLS